MRHKKLLAADRTMLLVADVQDAFLPHIDDIGRVIQRCRVMIEAAHLLQLPIIVTEQYPKGLGRTLEPLRRILPDQHYHNKLAFSCLEEPAIAEAILATDRKQVLIVGIEAHICVSQTAHDLQASGFEPYIAADAVSSRRTIDTQIALERMRHAGITISTTEAAIMEMTVSSRHPEFKNISHTIK